MLVSINSPSPRVTTLKSPTIEKMRAILLFVELWAFVQMTRAYAKGPRLFMCATFHVDHVKSVNGTSEDVQIILRKVTSPGNDSEEVSCYVPSQEYTGKYMHVPCVCNVLEVKYYALSSLFVVLPFAVAFHTAVI